MGESLPDAEMDKVMAEYGKVQDAIEARERLGPGPHAGDRDGRAALPASRRGRHEDLGR